MRTNVRKSTSRTKTRKLVIVAMLSAISIFLGLTGLGFIIIPPVKATIMHIPVIIGAILEGPVVGGLIGLVFGLFSMYQAFTAPEPTSFLFWNPIIAILPRILIGVGSYYIYIISVKAAKKNLKLTAIIGDLLVSILVFLAISAIAKAVGSTESTANIIAIIVGIILFIIIITVIIRFKHTNKEEALSIGISAVLGTMINTIGVLGLAYILYLNKFASALHISSTAAGGVIVGIGVTNGIPESIISAIVTIPVVLAIKKIRK
ncbi:MAG: ECF transporter S component [Sarcina sp.]